MTIDRLGIADIVKKEFSRSFMGYDMKEVDSFLDALTEQLRRDEQEKQELLTAMEYLLAELELRDDAENQGRKILERKAEDA